MFKVTLIRECQRKVPLSSVLIKKIIFRSLQLMKVKTAGEVSVVMAKKSLMQRLNREYRGRDKPTDILSFPLESKENLGDIFLCPAYINQDYKNFGYSLKKHYALLLIHGTLHLLGYDHEKDKDFAIMERHQNRLLQKICLEFKIK